MIVSESPAVDLPARQQSDPGARLRAPASAPSYDGAGEPRNVLSMSVTRPDSTGAALKASLNAAREELRAAIARGAGGRGALERYADRVDALIRQLLTDAGPYEGPVAIVALGGYGRRHLCLHSDIDLLLLFGSGIGPAEERFVHRFLNPLWDLGVVVGHQVRDIEDFLLRVRSTLHLECGRNQNVLSHELQERTAEMLGYPGAEPRQRVEKLMSDYFRHARIVSRSLEWARRTAPVPVGANLGRSRDGVRFIDPIQVARHPASWPGAFQAALDSGTEVSEEALSCIQQHVDRYRADDFFAGAQDRGALLRFLTPRAGLYARLSQMHDCGLLGRVFPEFQAISWRVVRDFYHKYTVDEHTLLTIRNLERLTSNCPPGRERFGALIQDLEKPELLVLSLLFHDV